MLLGIDLGTSSLRAAVVDEAGRIAGLGQEEYGIDSPRPGWAEQDTAVWWRAAVTAVRRAVAAAGVRAEAIGGIGLSGQMHGTVLVDAEERPLGPAIIWADGRSAEEARRLNDEVGLERLAAVAGNRVSPGFMAATLAWLARRQPGRLGGARWSLLPKDYLRLRMTGEAATEPSDAGASLLLDITTDEWSPDLLAAAGVEAGLLPPVMQSAAVAGRLRPRQAEELGLAPGTPVVAGAGDQAAQAVGNGVISERLASSTIGTGGQVFQPCSRPVADPLLRLHCFRHAVPGTWFLMAAMLSAGLSLRWWRDTLHLQGPDAYALLDAEAGAVPPGAEGLLFLPYLLGERTPHMDPAARGALVGMTLRHGRGHVARAIMEGVALALRDGMALMRQLADGPAQIVASGGGARSELWVQIQADVFGLPLTSVLGQERAVVGAAMLAGIGTGVYGGYEEARDACVRYGAVREPDPARAGFYDELYAEYRALYPGLRERFHALGRLATV